MDEFQEQLDKQRAVINDVLGVTPSAVWNTELLYSDEMAYNLYKMGYKVMLAEGAKHVMSWKSPNYLYTSAGAPKMKMLVRNAGLSDELSFHFSDSNWYNYPMDAEKYANQLHSLPEGEDLINIWVGAILYSAARE